MVHKKLYNFANACAKSSKNQKSIEMWRSLETLAYLGTSSSWYEFCAYLRIHYNNTLPHQLRKPWVIQVLRNYSFRHDTGIFFLGPEFLRTKDKIAPIKFITRGRVIPQEKSLHTF